MKKITKLAGFEISSYPLNEAILQCKFKLTYSDALELCKKTKSGLIKNKDLKDLFYEMIMNELDKFVKEVKEKRKNVNIS